MSTGLTWVQIAQGCAAVVTILMAVAIGPLFKLLHKIRTNDLHHLDLKIDGLHKAMTDKLDRVSSDVSDISKRLEAHIQWHLNREN